MINGVLPQVHLIMGSVAPPYHLVVISSVLECITGIDTLSCWKNNYVDAMTCVRGTIMVGEDKWKTLDMTLLRKIGNRN